MKKIMHAYFYAYLLYVRANLYPSDTSNIKFGYHRLDDKNTSYHAVFTKMIFDIK